MKSLTVLVNVMYVFLLNASINAIDIYWITGGNACQNGQAELCQVVDFKSVLCCASILENSFYGGDNNFASLYFNPPKSIGFYPWDVSEGYWNFYDEFKTSIDNLPNINFVDGKIVSLVSLDPSNARRQGNGSNPSQLNAGALKNDVIPSEHFDKQTRTSANSTNNYTKLHDEKGTTNGSSPQNYIADDALIIFGDSLKPLNNILGADGKELPKDVKGARLTPGAKGVNIKKPFYRPTIENSTSLRMCKEYFAPFHRPVKSISKEYPRRIRNFRPYVTGGVDAVLGQFPHLGLLGYGEADNISWACGGSLISDRYVLTAAHCLTSNMTGKVKYVRFGELNLNSTADDIYVRDFTVENTIKHPLYNFISGYHDIALIRLNQTIQYFNAYIRPACLATTRNLTNAILSIAGWGQTSDQGFRASILQTATVDLVKHARCKKFYRKPWNLGEGILDDVHICADGGMKESNACRGDSGGPLQFTNYDYKDEGLPSFVEIAGVVSFGIACGRVPGVYTRVLPYVEWIESEVWG